MKISPWGRDECGEAARGEVNLSRLIATARAHEVIKLRGGRRGRRSLYSENGDIREAEGEGEAEAGGEAEGESRECRKGPQRANWPPFSLEARTPSDDSFVLRCFVRIVYIGWKKSYENVSCRCRSPVGAAVGEGGPAINLPFKSLSLFLPVFPYSASIVRPH